MKKIYQNPEMKVVKLHSAAKLMAGSMRYGGSTTATNGNLSRGNRGWDDDEEDY